MVQRIARLTLLMGPKKKTVFEKLCSRVDVTAFQRFRQFIRENLEEEKGMGWKDQIF